MVRNSIRWMSPEEETGRIIESKKEAVGDVKKKEYVAWLTEKGTSLKEYSKQAEILVAYHEALVEFLNKPRKKVNAVSKARKKRPDYGPELYLYHAITGDRKGLRKSTRLFVKIWKRNVIRVGKYGGVHKKNGPNSRSSAFSMKLDMIPLEPKEPHPPLDWIQLSRYDSRPIPKTIT